MKIGLIGCGNIGQFLLEALNVRKVIPDYRLVSVYGRPGRDVSAVVQDFHVKAYDDFQSFLESDIDLVIEAANIEAVKDMAPRVIRNGKDLVIVSVGALADADFYREIKELCEEKGTKILIPSGAIGGLDILKAAMATQQLDFVSITTRKPPKALSKPSLELEEIVFEGPASEAIEQFPQNINVSIILSIVGLGSQQTNVKIIADPKVDKNNHYIEAKGAFGSVKINIENHPMPSNPKTSYLAALSVLSTLKNKKEIIQVG